MPTELFIITHKDTGDIWVSNTGKWSWTSKGQQTAAWNRTHKRLRLDLGDCYWQELGWQELGNPNCRYERNSIIITREIEDYEDWLELCEEHIHG